MEIYLTGNKPIFEEIIDSMRLYIKHGILKQGERLPSVRELALSLAVNPNTVMRAYQILTDEGLLVSIPKKGLYVAGDVKEEEPSKLVLLRLKEILKEGYKISDIEKALKQLKEEKAHD